MSFTQIKKWKSIVAKYSNVKRKKKYKRQKIISAILLVWSHPRAQRARQFNWTQNNDVDAMF